jgi:hypothetical protein
VWVEQVNHSFTFATKDMPVSFVLFDEGSFILKKTTFTKTPEELRAQLEKAEYMLDRYDALVALGKLPMSERKVALMAAWKRETNKNMLAEIVRQLVSDSTADAAFVNEAYAHKKVEVRKSVIQHASVNTYTAAVFQAALKDSSYQIIETALLKLWAVFPDQKSPMLEQIKDLDGQAMALKVRYLELGTEAYPDMKDAFIGQLTDLCGEKYEFRTRINAMQALQRLNACNKMVVLNLYDAMLNFNSRLNAPAKDVLNYFKGQTSHLATMREVLRTGNYTEAQRQKLSATLGL